MKRKSQFLYKNSKVNGVGRNIVVHLSEDELSAMASEVNSIRRTGDSDRRKRRIEYVRNREALNEGYTQGKK